MLKKIITSVLMVCVFALSAWITGCEKDEIKTHRHTEVHDKVVDQDTVVE